MKRLTPRTVEAAIVATMGNVSAAAVKLGVSRASVYEYVRNRPALAAVLRETRESMLDNVETVLHHKAMSGEAWAVCFLLKTQGKARGYVERSEVVQQEATRIVVVEEIVDKKPTNPGTSPGGGNSVEGRP